MTLNYVIFIILQGISILSIFGSIDWSLSKLLRNKSRGCLDDLIMHSTTHESTMQTGTTVLPPSNAIRYGFQNDGTGFHYSVMADTRNGLIPGKASWVTGQCTCAYDGEEYSAEGYYWIVVEGLFD